MIILPITKARSKLGDLVDQTKGSSYVVLTKGGNPKAALVDIKYLTRLQDDLSKIYKKTYITSDLLPYTRQFSDREVAAWEAEDSAT